MKFLQTRVYIRRGFRNDDAAAAPEGQRSRSFARMGGARSNDSLNRPVAAITGRESLYRLASGTLASTGQPRITARNQDAARQLSVCLRRSLGAADSVAALGIPPV
jgi:hypothetical protein